MPTKEQIMMDLRSIEAGGNGEMNEGEIEEVVGYSPAYAFGYVYGRCYIDQRWDPPNTPDGTEEHYDYVAGWCDAQGQNLIDEGLEDMAEERAMFFIANKFDHADILAYIVNSQTL